jgi:hypothetical protein
LWDTLTFAPTPGSPLIDNGNPEFSDPDGSPCDVGIYGGPFGFRPAPQDTREKRKKK